MEEIKNGFKKSKTWENIILYTIFIGIALLGIIYGNSIKNEYQSLRIWDYENLLWLCLGIPFLFLLQKAGIPNFWAGNISTEHKVVVPVMIGIFFGILDVLVWKFILHPEPYEELPPFLQPFPYSLLLFFSGAFEIEVFYRLIPLTCILLLGQWFVKGKYNTYFFYIAVFLTSVREPLEQLPNESFILVLYSFLSGFIMNALQAIYFKKAGFLASLFLRLGHYLIWHIVLGIYVEWFEL
ncbi:hypothetical protein [Flavobacterium sp.]|uniref:hypothetical protein n=1 Tax=Flavobacterium sp. TaxID=239 RepID=UPI00262D69F6|nr:hypothetical protein [Flavobacterium sp.]